MDDKDLSIFCTQLALVLKSGIVLHEGIAMMIEDMEQCAMRDTLIVIEKDLSEGKMLDTALASVGSFPKYMTHMVKIGAISGRLEDVMTALGSYYEREEALKQSIKSAVFYPLILSSMMLIVMLVLSIKVLPIFQEVFNNLGGEISGIAQSFMKVGEVTGQYIYVIVVGIILITLGVIAGIKTKRGKYLARKLTSKLKITEKIATARFASAMALMMASGLDTDEALKMSTQLVENENVMTKAALCEQRLAEGNSFVSALSESQIFSKLATRMLSMGMKTGNMDEVMKQVADNYEEEVHTALNKRVAIIEPVSVAVLSIMIGSILISVMIPLMGIMSSIG
ncbi:type II secretion system F family protein [Cellulosilyticum sp. I15G10I2]|uniref:type II secretion system F family protein n=1 Tax=Cellulosilyticum sp. I15G10I2 TaxID=1892843 RepID=UPI00085C721F|nr:type II secretion system F family protein [Cellulosilyticum sp. I15G10I2]